MPSNCPWCAADGTLHSGQYHILWTCGAIQDMPHLTPRQSARCRIRELEAELAGVEGLLAACLLLAKSQSAFDDACDTQDRGGKAVPDLVKLKYTKAWSHLEKCCRELAEKKGQSDAK